MFEAKLTKGDIFKKAIGAIKELIDNASFVCTADGISVDAMDTSHVALVQLLLNATAFEPYRCDTNQNLDINLKNMAKVLSSADTGSIITLQAEHDADLINIRIESSDSDKTYDYDLKLYNIEESDRVEVPEQEYAVEVSMASAEFTKICNDVSNLSETTKMEVGKDGLRFISEGEEGSLTIHLSPTQSIDDEDKGVSITMTEPLSQAFSMKYLKQFCKAAPLSKRVNLKLSNDIPLLVEYIIDDIGHIRYYLAPKLDGNMDVSPS